MISNNRFGVYHLDLSILVFFMVSCPQQKKIFDLCESPILNFDYGIKHKECIATITHSKSKGCNSFFNTQRLQTKSFGKTCKKRRKKQQIHSSHEAHI